jgi:hypothetical protein
VRSHYRVMAGTIAEVGVWVVLVTGKGYVQKLHLGLRHSGGS